ncbi:amino acid adenylation domain-containing protein [Nocardia sp. NPDC051756]|uniref:amino acid adenylation domain-containing protein n=1 Tax=Nocardia sp. NPDC051756 TaxID=3154751 RepID=UPI00342B4E43
MTATSLETALPLSPLQEGLFVHALVNRDGVDEYISQVALQLDGEIDQERLRSACAALVRRHAVLRTSFHQRKSGQTVQLVHKDVTVLITDLDLTAEPESERRSRLRGYLSGERLRGFDLGTPPLIRFGIVRMTPDRQVLALTHHHILIDGWSLPILVRDLITLYATGDDAALPPAVSMTGYLSWLSKQDPDAAAEAWRQALAGLGTPTLVAPEGPEVPRRMPASATAELSEEQSAALIGLARNEELTLNTIVQVAWALVLTVLTGDTDVVFGQTVSVRPAQVPEIGDAVGLLINSTPVRVRLDPAETVTALLHRVQHEQAALAEHNFLGQAEIKRLAGHGALFDTAVAVGNPGADRDATMRPLPGVQLTMITADGDGAGQDSAEGYTHYPLSLLVVPGRRVLLELNYRTESFTRAAGNRVLNLLRAVLTTIAFAPSGLVGRIESLDAAERTTVLGWATGPKRALTGDTLHSLFETQSRRTPDAIALSDRTGDMTYAELNAAANRLAAELIGRGVGPDDRVAVLWPHNAEQIVVLLAVLKAGGTYLPIDLALPPDRISFLLSDAAPVITLAAAGVDAPQGALRLDSMDLDRHPAVDITDEQRHRPLRPEHPAYVCYTSGSTGRPKGVQTLHRSAVSYLAFARATYPGLGTLVMVHTPTSFDFTMTGVYGTLSAGGRVYMIPREETEPSGVGLARFGKVTPAHLPLLTSTHPWIAATENLVLGGEQLVGESLRDLRTAFPTVTVTNEYGPTETTVGCMDYRIEPGDDIGPGAVPIGRPLPNSETYVLDPWLRPVAPGVPGELYIGGIGLARGYLGRPGLSAERFVANPFGRPGERMYRTGDIVWWSDEGQMVFGGRRDDQVKIRGHRIELAEIEGTLAQHPLVDQVVVVAQHGRHSRRLVAYVVPAADQVDLAELNRHAASQLPEYMVPEALLLLPELPLTSSGKVDRSALPPIPADHTLHRAARNEVEQRLCLLYAEVLGVDQVGVHNGFYELGGDSILSLQLVAKARKAGLLLTPTEVFVHRTVAALAALPTITDGAEAGPAAADDGVGEFPAMPIVHRLRELGGPVDSFNQSVLLAVPPDLGLTPLVTAVQALLDRHPALRMRLAEDWSFVVGPVGSVAAADRVRRVEADEDTLAAVITEQSTHAVARLSPRSGRMVEVLWFDAGRAPGRLLVVAHHLAVDGMSWRILLPDLYTAWQAARDGRPAALDPVPTSLRTWSRTLTAVATRPTWQAELDQWRRTLSAEHPGLTNRELDPVRDVHGTAGTLTIRLSSADTVPLLTTLPAKFRAGANDVLLTGLALAVAGWRRSRGLGQGSEILVDLEGHGREDVDGLDLSRTVGWFTTLHPVCLDPGAADLDDASLGRAIKRIKEQLRSTPHNGIGYGLLRYLTDDGRAALEGCPSPQIAFNYLGRFANGPDAPWQAVDESVVPPVDPARPLEHLVELNAVTEDNGSGAHLTATWTWASALLTDQDVRQLSDAWLAALRALAAYADKSAGGLTPSDAPLVSITQEDLDQLTVPVAEILPLSPTQQGLLFHARYAADALDIHHIQSVFELDGSLDPTRLRMACNRLVQRHEALRAAFVLLRSGEPVQIVADQVDLPWHSHDLRGLDPAEQQRRLADQLARDRLEPFDMAIAPLMRCMIIRLAERRYSLVVTMHHILVDGWSSSIVLRDLAHLYQQHGDQSALPGTTPYRFFFEWLSRQEQATARDAWREALSGVPEPTLVAPRVDSAQVRVPPERTTMELSGDATAALTRVARTHGVTVNTVVQVAWALTLHQITGQSDIVFGSTVSGRPPNLPGYADIVGLLINTVPVRVRFDPDTKLGTLLTDVQHEQLSLTEHQHIGLSEIRRVAQAGELFDTCVVFQNYADAGQPWSATETLRIVGVTGHDPYHFPLKLTVTPEDRLHLALSHRPDLVTTRTAERVGGLLVDLLHAIANRPLAVGGDLLPDRARLREVQDTLAELVANVLGRDQVGLDDDFFAAGGDSLLALRLSGAVEAALSCTVDIRAIFQRRTVRRIAPLCLRAPIGSSPQPSTRGNP